MLPMTHYTTAAEAERIAYAEGFVETAKLFARIEALEHAIREAIDHLDAHDVDLAQCTLNEVLP